MSIFNQSEYFFCIAFELRKLYCILAFAEVMHVFTLTNIHLHLVNYMYPFMP